MLSVVHLLGVMARLLRSSRRRRPSDSPQQLPIMLQRQDGQDDCYDWGQNQVIKISDFEVPMYKPQQVPVRLSEHLATKGPQQSHLQSPHL